MRYYLILAAIGIALASPASANSPSVAATAEQSHNALARELMSALKLDQQFDLLIPKVTELMLAAFTKGNEERMSEVNNIVSDEMTTVFLARKSEFVVAIQKVYADNFSDAELTDLTTFYKSAIGQKFVSKQAELTVQGMKAGGDIGRRAAQEAAPRIIERLRKAKLAVPSNT